MLPRPVNGDVYLDTSFVVNAVFDGPGDSKACNDATEQLIEARQPAYASDVMWIEFAQALRRLATRQRLPADLVEEFDLDSWANSSVRRRWMGFGIDQLEDYLGLLPEFVQLPFDKSRFEESIAYMAEYSLGSQDAVHLATALHYEIPVFWTCDDHFARVDDLHVAIIRDGA